LAHPVREVLASLSPDLKQIGAGEAVADMADIAHEGERTALFHQQERQDSQQRHDAERLNQVLWLFQTSSR
jgi:hypothetical protein